MMRCSTDRVEHVDSGVTVAQLLVLQVKMMWNVMK